MLIDVHAHLDFPQFDPDRDEVIERAAKEDILIINSGLGVEGARKTLDLAGRHDNVYAALGMSPTEFDEKEINAVIDLIRENIDRIVAIGEVGLDYYWVKDDLRRWQEAEYFRRFIALSDEVGLPLVVHSRGAEADVLQILEESGNRALLHCFGGTAKQAGEAASFGHLISMPTNVVYSKRKQEIVEAIAMNRLVLETDSPYLAPVPKTRNEPVNIRLSAEKIAGVKGVASAAVAKATTANAKRFFNLR
jgi:TatD DNase family protein